MTRGYIEASPLPPEMGFDEFLKRAIQTDPAELDNELERKRRPTKIRRPKRSPKPKKQK